MLAWLRNRAVAAGVIASLAGGIVLGLRQLGMLETLELAAYDWYVRARPHDPRPEPRILLVAITEEDISRIRQWPLPDGALAGALATLLRREARAVGLDLYRDVPVPPGTEELDAVLRSDPRIVVVTKFAEGSRRGVGPPPALAGTEQVGFNDFVVDPGGTVRRGLLFLDDGKTVLYSLALRLALLYLQHENVTPQEDPDDPGLLRLGSVSIHPVHGNTGGYVGVDARGYQFLLDFKSAPNAFATVSFSSLMAGDVDPALIRDRVVIIGTIADSIRDEFFTPHSRGLGFDLHIPGLVMHAHIVGQLMRIGLEGAAPVIDLPDGQEAAWILVWGLAGGAVGLAIRSPWRSSLAAVGGLVTLGGLDFAMFLAGWWLPLVPPAMAWVGAAALVTGYVSHRETMERAQLMQLFSRHVSREVAETIWRQRDQFLDGGRPRPQRLVATLLFADIAGYTPVAEKLPPEELMEWLGTYMEAMTRQVTAHGGVIQQYAGDAVVVAFGVPVPRATAEESARDAIRAVDCALAMGETLRELNRRWRSEGQPGTGMRIGIFTGPVVGGLLGSAERSEYLLIGDAVNTAARLESLDKDLYTPDQDQNPCRILLGEATLACLGDRFQTEYVGNMSLKGKAQTVNIFRVTGRAVGQVAAAAQEVAR